MYKIKVGITPKALERKIRKDIENITDDALISINILIRTHLYVGIEDVVKKTSVYEDFQRHGPLWQRLGGGNLTEKLDGIIKHWVSSVHMDPSARVGANQAYRFTAIKADYSDVIVLPDAYFYSKSTRPDKAGETHRVPWLEWLLKKGREYVVREYIFTENLESKVSRGGGLMIPKKSAGWRVPQEHAGTVDDNFLTRSLAVHLDKIVDSINKDIRRVL